MEAKRSGFPPLLQAEIEARGLEIFSRMAQETPGVFSPRKLTGRLMDWSMRNEGLKVQLFRLVDVLPSLGSSREVAQHARDYLDTDTAVLPVWARWSARWSPRFPWLTAWAARQGVRQMARMFILARNGEEAVPVLRQMRDWPVAFTVDILGENRRE